jgi:uncharacterized protein (TIGR02231 family)
MSALLLAFYLAAQETKKPEEPKDPPKPAGKPGEVTVTPSQVSAVTVYPLTAMVTREAEVPAGKGAVELTVSPLPPAAILSSLNAEGSEGVRVLSTRFRSRTVTSDNREAIRKLQDELEVLATAREKLEADLRAVQDNLKTLGKMEGFMAVSTIQATEKAALNAEAAITLVKYIKEGRLEATREQVKFEQDVKSNQAKATAIQSRITELTAGTSRTERDAVIVVDRGNAGAGGKVRLYYLVDQASWRPQYKLRAGKAVKDPVHIEFLASVMQNSGEDWANVNLVLSTAQPMLNAAPPDLQSLRVAAVHKTSVATRPLDAAELEDQVRNLRNKAQKDFNERKAGTGIGLFNTAAALDQAFELQNPDTAIARGCALVIREGPTVTYRVNNSLTVPSRTDEQVVEVARAELAPEFYYKAVPLITTHVYRLADFVNKTERVILPGEATMYIGSDFVGQMSLPFVAAGEQFTVGFGIEPQMQVTRQIVNKTHTTQGGNQTLRYEYRTVVNSFKSEQVKLQVWDRLPRPESDAVTVSIIKTSPEISKDRTYLRGQRNQNLLRWDLTVEPNSTGEKAVNIQYEFKMELDRNMTISDLSTAGASASTSSQLDLPPITAAEQAKIDAAIARLSPADQVAARAQVFCAVDQDTRLGSMGPIQKVMVKNQPVFLCCRGCEAEARTHPDETLVKLQNMMNRMSKRP